MPELPEVETIKNELAPWIVGQSFTKVTVSNAKLMCGCSAKEVQRGLIGQKLESMERRGKYLIFHLSNGNALIIHLRMTGSLLLDPRENGRYIRAAFCLSNGHRFVLSDRRRLGKMWLTDDADAVGGLLVSGGLVVASVVVFVISLNVPVYSHTVFVARALRQI